MHQSEWKNLHFTFIGGLLNSLRIDGEKQWSERVYCSLQHNQISGECMFQKVKEMRMVYEISFLCCSVKDCLQWVADYLSPEESEMK
jgi:hypothetical protein